MAKLPGHLRALRRSRAMAAVPLTFRWTSADPRSQSCRIGGEGGLAVKKWRNLWKNHGFTMENHETWRKTTVLTMENMENAGKTHGKKDERIGKSAENLWKTMRSGRFIMQFFHLLEPKKRVE